MKVCLLKVDEASLKNCDVFFNLPVPNSNGKIIYRGVIRKGATLPVEFVKEI